MTADAGTSQEAARRIGAALAAPGIKRCDLLGEGTAPTAALLQALATEAEIGGTVEGRLPFVGYTMRGEKIRIITARKAEPYERRRYHDENREA